MDPDGNYIIPLLFQQYQNSEINNNVYVGQYITYSSKKYDEKENTIGNFGCFFSCFVNIGNTYNGIASPKTYVEKTIASLASNDNYFEFESISRIAGMPTDFISSIDNLKTLLFDMTGEKFNIVRYEGKSIFPLLLLADASPYEFYVVGRVITKHESVHFININSVDTNGKINYFDPYQYNNLDNRKDYSIMNLTAIYLIYRTGKGDLE